ncbi:MAG: DEAD/DEAH box helicase [Erysipelotrichaceae bacterium]|nr:DEAD/DEAH box helicase [Erysipelotrichaceae bacterium]
MSEIMTFSELNLSAPIIRALEEIGYETPTEIQKQCIPVLLEHHDLLGQSQTGTGKTAAFALPVLMKLEPVEKKRPQVLILCPTRELCLQVGAEIRKYAKYIEGYRTVCIYGGEPINHQILDLKKGGDIIVGTPGRVLDHIRRKTLRFSNLHTFILDEADEMLNMGFIDDILEVCNALPEDRQTVLFSATMPKEILHVAKTIQRNPVEIRLKEKTLTVEAIEQRYYECSPTDKKNLLMQCIQMMNPSQAMIFCNTKKTVDDLCAELVAQHYPAAAIHGDMKQESRTKVMDNFKAKKLNFLIATDVAARGIDVSNMDVVFNYDLPQEAEYYVHRIGRTGRAGNTGLAVTFITPRQRNKLHDIEVLTRSKLTKMELPSEREMKQLQINQIRMQMNEMLSKPVAPAITALLEEMMFEGYSYKQIAEALASGMLKQSSLETLAKAPEENSLVIKSDATSWIVINVGHDQDINAAHVVSAIAEVSGLSGTNIGKIKIDQDETFVEIPKEVDKKIIKALKKQTIKGYPIQVTLLNEAPGFLRKYRKTDVEEKKQEKVSKTDKPAKTEKKASKAKPKKVKPNCHKDKKKKEIRKKAEPRSNRGRRR